MLLAGESGPAGSIEVVFSSCVVLLSGEDILSYLAPIARCIAVQLLHARCIAASISIQRIHFHVCKSSFIWLVRIFSFSTPALLCFVVYSCVSIDLMKVCRFMYWLIRLSWESLTFCIYFHVPTLLVSSLIMQVLPWESKYDLFTTLLLYSSMRLLIVGWVLFCILIALCLQG